MEDLQKMPLEATEEAVDKRWSVEMEGVLTLMSFEELPVQNGSATGP